MSLSIDPEYLAKYGIKAVDGPHAGRYLTDDAAIRRSIAWTQDGKTIGFYKLKGRADGELEYVWSDLASIHEGSS